MKHGARGSYVSGCRCKACVAANTEYMRRYKTSLQRGPCQCDDCKRGRGEWVAPVTRTVARRIVQTRDPLTGREHRFEVVTDLILGDVRYASGGE